MLTPKPIFSRKANSQESRIIPSSPTSLDELENQFYKDDKDDNLQPIDLITILGGIFIIGFWGIAVILSAFIKYPVVIKVNAQVRPQKRLNIVQSSASGKIAKILVKENQSIGKGNEILILENKRLSTDKSQLENKIERSQSELNKIESRLNRHRILINTETDKTKHSINILNAELKEIEHNYQNRKKNISLREEEVLAELKSAQEELKLAQEELILLQEELELSKFAFNKAKSKQKQYFQLASEDVISQERLEAAILAVKRSEQDLQVTRSRQKTQAISIQQRIHEIDQAQARYRQVKVDLNTTPALIIAHKQRIARETTNGQAKLINLKNDEDKLLQYSFQLKQTIDHDEKELQQINRLLRQTVIRSPAKGIIFNLSFDHVDQNINSGDLIATIAPYNSSLKIKGLVKNSDINKVKVGQKVKTRIAACPYPDYGTLSGKVIRISPDSLASSIPNSYSGQKRKIETRQNYEVTIEPETDTFGRNKNICSLKLGMEGRSDILVHEESILKFLWRKARLGISL